jgi:hypothetical protein
MDSTSRTLIILGIVVILAGLLWHFTDGKIPFGRLPGDIRYESQHIKIYIPLTSGLIISALFSLIMYFFRK